MAAKQKSKPRPPADPVPAQPQPPLALPSAPTSLLPTQSSLKLLVLVAGAVLMGLEIVGSRILAPYFGNSVFVWGSLISLFLIALSAGYYIGGGWSDRHPSRVLLNSIVLAVAAWMFFIPVMADPVCDALLRSGFGEKSGPFLAAGVLFLLPSIGMGMVSPFAIRLATETVSSVGKTAGTLYALSTLGSILGTMLTTFVLIPAFGASAILQGLAAALLLTAALTFPFASRGSAARGLAVALAVAAAGVFGLSKSEASLPYGLELVREINSPYHHIAVIDDTTAGYRQLKFDRFSESQIQINPPHEPPLHYYTRYFHLALAAKPETRRALFIGAGGGVGPRAFHMHDAAMEIDVVDIDQKVLDVAELDFFLEKSPNMRLIAADGRTFICNAPDGHYDCILLDAFTIGGRIPFHLVTTEFFKLCREKLAPGGVFVMNINSAVHGEKSQIFQSMYKTIEAAFPGVDSFALGSQFGARDDSTNIIFVAVNRDAPMTPEDWTTAADAYESASYVDQSQMQSMIKDHLQTLPDMNAAAVFTDDFAPIETMSF
jgi:spermidine synthase